MTALVKSIAEWNSVAPGIRREEVVGFVPTMGALHRGHGALLEEARRRCSVVVASIFVNPIQFNQKSDYDLYPRILEDDMFRSHSECLWKSGKSPNTCVAEAAGATFGVSRP